MDQLVQRANRHNADRVIVGEVLGDEIVPMLNAMTAGKAGSMCTIHADSTEGTFGRIQSYASQSPKHLSDAATAKLTAQALDLVVFVRQQPAAGVRPPVRELHPSGRGLRRATCHLDRDLRRATKEAARRSPTSACHLASGIAWPTFGYEAPIAIFGR